MNLKLIMAQLLFYFLNKAIAWLQKARNYSRKVISTLAKRTRCAATLESTCKQKKHQNILISLTAHVLQILATQPNTKHTANTHNTNKHQNVLQVGETTTMVPNNAYKS